MNFQRIGVVYGEESPADEKGNYDCQVTCQVTSNFLDIPDFDKIFILISNNSQIRG
jgi:hypothetical protein